jgi:hypothetical protein
LGIVPLDAAGNGRLIAESPALVKLSDAAPVYAEPAGQQSRPDSAQKPIIAWPVEQ